MVNMRKIEARELEKDIENLIKIRNSPPKKDEKGTKDNAK